MEQDTEAVSATDDSIAPSSTEAQPEAEAYVMDENTETHEKDGLTGLETTLAAVDDKNEDPAPPESCETNLEDTPKSDADTASVPKLVDSIEDDRLIKSSTVTDLAFHENVESNENSLSLNPLDSEWKDTDVSMTSVSENPTSEAEESTIVCKSPNLEKPSKPEKRNLDTVEGSSKLQSPEKSDNPDVEKALDTCADDTAMEEKPDSKKCVDNIEESSKPPSPQKSDRSDVEKALDTCADDPEMEKEPNSEKCVEVDVTKQKVSEPDESLWNLKVGGGVEAEKKPEATESAVEYDTKKFESINSESSLDGQEKDALVEKNVSVIEPENTEFVQISQEDKHDESHIENQSIDNAEDPFGGDNENSEHPDDDHMEADNLDGEIADLQKLGDQADNLQDVVKAKDNFQPDKSKDDLSNEILSKADSGDSVADVISDNTVDETVKVQKLVTTPSIENEDISEENNKGAVEERDTGEAAEGKESPGDDETQKDGKEGEKLLAKTSLPPLGAEDISSDVLPGQDDELCIIPDSMKVILPGGTAEKTSEDVESQKKPEEESVENNAVDSEKIMDDDQSVTIVKKPVVTKAISGQLVLKKGRIVTVKSKGGKPSSADVINLDDDPQNSESEGSKQKEKCKQCNKEQSCKIKVKIGTDCFNVCSKECRNSFKAANNKATDIPSDGVNSKREKRCAGCLLIVDANDEKNLSWETMEFCNEECLGKFQTKYGSYCRNCNGSVQAVSLGKYCVRFGYDVRQFCCSTCLEEFKKGLKVCSYCQKDISSGTEGFLAPVGDKGQFKDFCTQDCMEKYSRMSSSEPPASVKKSCSVCQQEKIVHCEVQIDGGTPAAICSDPCFAAFKFVNKVDPDQCSTCKKFFQLLSKKNFVVFYEGEAHMFCNKTCLNVFIITNRKIVPCNWCKVKKYNFDMIKKELKSGQVMMMCSLNCLTLYQVSINAVSARRINCDFCKEFSQAQYHLTMSDATIRNFCSYKCVMNFQSQYTKSPITIPSSDDPVPTGNPKRSIAQQRSVVQPSQKQPPDLQTKSLPIISSVTSLASIANGQTCSPTTQQNQTNNIGTNVSVQSQPPQVLYTQQIISRPASPTKVHNKVTQCKPLMHTKGVSVRPHPCTKSTQTDDTPQILIPIPVPIYVPFPMHMYSMPFPVPFPFPLPIPVPIFIPTTRNSAKGIFKEIKRIQEKIPADPFEAELLMMAEMVATEKKRNESDSDSEDDNRDDVADVPANSTSDGFSPDGVDSSHAFGDDMLQMALKMATGELDEPAVDLEAALTPNTITATQAPPQQDSTIDGDVQPERLITSTRGRKRMVPYKPRSTPSKRGRRVSGTNDIPLMPPPEPQLPPQPRIMEPIEKPDANMALKYTFGVNAWRQWVVGKNAELEKQSTPARRVKLFKTDLLQLTADELNYSLCLFVKEVRKPNGAEYAPDTIYYLCLGIQQYLFENNRIDNIFTDSYYEKFTECLNDVAKKFSVLYNDAQYIVTRVEEEHLWESKQLGAHSPHVLLSTLMFFNTKHFNLVTVDEHMQLSFSHIMKHWKRNPAAQPAAVAGKAPGSRNVLLRFYPPQSALEANSRKKKVYEQQENEDNPLRCPVKLYEFYLSKCPESVKTRNDVFYLLPERSCVPDSPVWYSTSALAKEHLIKMLYRVKMVKEINVALLTS